MIDWMPNAYLQVLVLIVPSPLPMVSSGNNAPPSISLAVNVSFQASLTLPEFLFHPSALGVPRLALMLRRIDFALIPGKRSLAPSLLGTADPAPGHLLGRPGPIALDDPLFGVF